ncbi:MAG TPA: hypothetical protein PKC39_07480 [Ferruginibacter sp.]|nr:hypothetical protein [Ferruginibacter sp.]HMP20784.1 hypothetical protein [Ferruginibacter sp.]
MKFKLALLVMSVTLIAANCRKKADPPFNPCKDKTAFKADFVIEESVGDTSYITDKALAPGYVYFKAKGDYDSLRWFIGGGTQNTSTNKTHVLYFTQADGDVEVTLIGYRKPNTQCFPNDKSADTLKKVVSILPRDQTAAIVGRFLGYNTNEPSDTFSVYVNADNSVGIWQYFVKNLPKNCPGYVQVSDEHPRNIGLSVASGYSAFRIKDAASTVCASVTGFGELKNNDSLIINYSAIPMPPGPPFPPFTPGGERTQYKFIGVRKP